MDARHGVKSDLIVMCPVKINSTYLVENQVRKQTKDQQVIHFPIVFVGYYNDVVLGNDYIQEYKNDTLM